MLKPMKRGPDKQFDPQAALQQAMEVFWARGYEAASLSELMAAMGIGKKSLYDTFGNKRALFLKCLEHYADSSLRCLEDRLANVAPDKVAPEIRRILEEWRKMHGCANSKGCMLGTNMADFDCSDAEVAGILRGHLATMENAFAKALKKAQSKGGVKLPDTPRRLARTLVCLSQGVALVGRVMECSEVTDNALQVASKQLLGVA